MNMADILLAAFLREPQFYAQYSSIVEPGMFDNSTHRVAINVYLDYIKQYSKMPTEEEMYVDLSKYCVKYGVDNQVKQSTIEVLQKCYTLNYNLEYARDNFVKYATTNKLTEAVIDAAKLIRTKGDNLSERDYESIHEQIEKAITIKARDTEGVMFSDVADDPVAYIQDHNRYDKASVVRTGIASFDNAHIAGGPIPGELYVVSAPPGRGKSTLLINVGAAALIAGKDVIHIFVGDNTEADGVLRYSARLSGVSMSQIMLHSEKYLASWTHIKNNFNLGNLMIGAYPIDGPTVADIRSFITKNMIQRGIKPAVLIIDYIDNCRRNDQLNSYEALGQLYKQMKNACEELKIIGWTASQPKIDVWDSEANAGLSSLAESSMKQHILDGMITMTKKGENQYQMYVPKLRRGRSDFNVDLLVEYDRMLIKESFVSRANYQESPSNNSSNPPPNPFSR